MPDIKKEEQTRADIIAAAQKLFKTYGLDKTTMDDIATAAGKGKSSLYYYFKSKEDVFYAVAKIEMDKIAETVRLALAGCKAPTERLKSLLITRYHATKSKIVLYSALLQDSSKHINLYQRIQRETNNEQVDILKQILLDGIKCGEFKSIKEDECASLAVVAMMVSRGLDANILISGELPPESIRLEAAVEVFVRGLA
ncbi:MAG: TetR/AcrR family transcriptional regulator [Elusimicrobiaceae bacterium]|nr:TetR/AcrR family transcriptional regulator [Elusimicrobiaceae bacterium]